ncbi:MAG: hypothetical protein MZW92_13520 [Comamonadaceae bacterium]|nr:hypothetical protein [Comamonadaceae bacterium]
MYRTYRDRGFVVLGFPSNDFGGQEPGSAKQIAEFCQANFGVSFPMFAKTGGGGGPRQRAATKTWRRQTGARPQWNFHKYLIDRSGKRVHELRQCRAARQPRPGRRRSNACSAMN